MKKPQPRTTEIIKSKKIKGLFYEGFKREDSEKESWDNDDLIVAFHYNGVRFDLYEFIIIKPSRRFEPPPGFKKTKGEPLIGRIIEIDIENDDCDSGLIIRVEDANSKTQGLFMVTEIKK